MLTTSGSMNLYSQELQRIISSENKAWDAIRVIPVASLTAEVVATAITILKKNKIKNDIIIVFL